MTIQYLFGKNGVDTAENEPSENLKCGCRTAIDRGHCGEKKERGDENKYEVMTATKNDHEKQDSAEECEEVGIYYRCLCY